MPRVKIEDREYGMGADIDPMPEDVKGYGPREIGSAESFKLNAKLSAFGFEPVTAQMILDVYVIEDGARRRVTFGGRPVRVVALDAVLLGIRDPGLGTPESPQPPADAGEPIPLELVPEDETPTGEIPASEQPEPVDESPSANDPSDLPGEIEPKPEGD